MNDTITTTNPAVSKMQVEWEKAKEAENQWKEYRLAIETQILETLKELSYDLPEKGKLQLEMLNIGFGLTRSWSQPSLGELIVQHPELLHSTFKTEYKPVSNPVIDKLLRSPSAMAVDLATCFEDKPKKPAFSLRK